MGHCRVSIAGWYAFIGVDTRRGLSVFMITLDCRYLFMCCELHVITGGIDALF